MPDSKNYKKYILVLNPAFEDDKILVDYIEGKHKRRHKDSYSSILRRAIEEWIKRHKE